MNGYLWLWIYLVPIVGMYMECLFLCSHDDVGIVS